jgi:hypothetical protein
MFIPDLSVSNQKKIRSWDLPFCATMLPTMRYALCKEKQQSKKE